MCRSTLAVIALVASLGVSQGLHAAQAGGSSRGAAKPPVANAININTASAVDLEALPGIGAKTAGRIIEYRQKNGPFKKVEELMNVQGIGEKNFLKLKNQITVGPGKAEHQTAQQ